MIWWTFHTNEKTSKNVNLKMLFKYKYLANLNLSNKPQPTPNPSTTHLSSSLCNSTSNLSASLASVSFFHPAIFSWISWISLSLPLSAAINSATSCVYELILSLSLCTYSRIASSSFCFCLSYCLFTLSTHSSRCCSALAIPRLALSFSHLSTCWIEK